MKKRSFDEMIAYFNRRVSEMDIDQDYKMELLGMVTAIGYKHEQTAPHWIPVTERLPEDDVEVIVSCTDDSGDTSFSFTTVAWHFKGTWICNNERCFFITAWMPLPEPYEGDSDD